MPEGTQILVPPAPPGFVSIKNLPNIPVVGDGVTNDGPNINAALVYATAHNNLPLWLPPTFDSNGNLTTYLSTSVDCPQYAAGQILRGAAKAASVIQVNDHNAIVPINNLIYNSEWDFSDFTVLGNASTVRFTTGFKAGPGQTHWMSNLRIAGFCRGMDIDAQPAGSSGASGVGNITCRNLTIDMPAYPTQFLQNAQPDFAMYLHSTGYHGHPQGMYFSQTMISGNRQATSSGFLLSDGTATYSSVDLNLRGNKLWAATGIQVLYYFSGYAVQLTQAASAGSNPLQYTLWDTDSTPVLIPPNTFNVGCLNIEVRFNVTPVSGQTLLVMWNDPTVRAAVRIDTNVGNENTWDILDISGCYIGFDADHGSNVARNMVCQVVYRDWRFGPNANSYVASVVESAQGTGTDNPLYGSWPYGGFAITSASGGSDFAVGQILTVTGGTLDLPGDAPAQIMVDNVSGGAIVNFANGSAGCYVLNGGSYSVPPPATISYTGGGTGATIVVDWETALTAPRRPPAVLAGGAKTMGAKRTSTNSPSTASTAPVAVSLATVSADYAPVPREVDAQGSVSLLTGQGAAIGIRVSYDAEGTFQYLPDWYVLNGTQTRPFRLTAADQTVIQPVGGSPGQPFYRIVATAAATASAATETAPGTGHAPGDVLTLATGLLSTVAPAQLTFPTGNGSNGIPPGGLAPSGSIANYTKLTVATTQVVGTPSVAAGGSSGTPGAVTLTGTTGTGTKFTASGTINGSGVLTGPLTLVTGGSYTVNPTTLSAEPVTGGGLVGATLAIAMGVNTVTVSQAGLLALPALNPVLQSSSTGSGAGAQFNVTWAASGESITFLPGFSISAAAVNAPGSAAPAPIMPSS